MNSLYHILRLLLFFIGSYHFNTYNKYYYDYIKLLAKKRNIDYNKAKEVVDNLIYEYIHLRNENGRFLSNNLSFYANVGYAKRKYTEIIAEAFSALDESQISQELIDLLR